MNEKTAIEIANKAASILNFLFKIMPLRFSGKEDRGFAIVTCDDAGKVVSVEERIVPATEDDSSVIYRVVLRGNIYQILLMESEDDYGYCSCLPNYDSSTYVFCEFEEGRSDRSKRCEMHFAFDIEKNTFLELFEIEHFSKNDFIRECQQIEYIESLLSGKEIFQ